jgi:ABC-type multidrug transport system fused ATPase/permease subunit
MQAEAYRRALLLLSSRRELVTARILGAVQSLLLLALLAVLSLYVALLASRGEARFPSAQLGLLPKWVQSRVAGADQQSLLFDDTGVFPVIADNLLKRYPPTPAGAPAWERATLFANNLLSGAPMHRGGAYALEWLTRIFPSLRTNLGALVTLIGMGLLFLVILAVVTRWRRRIAAVAATDVAAMLRRQIHRQMYRLGQSSLPTEGIGPVINLWTREVNDIRDGVFDDLDEMPRAQVLACGLLVLALLVSPLLTVFMASLGLLVWLVGRFLNRESRLVSETALRDASVQLCLLHEDLGLLRTVRVYGVSEYDRQRFDEHLERYERADMRRIRTKDRMHPTTALLYAAALAIALGLLGYNVVLKQEASLATMLILLVSLAGIAYPINEWLRMRRSIRHANRSARGIFEFLERRPELHQPVGAQFLNPLKEQIVFESVHLESRSGRKLLEDFSAEIPAGSRTAIMGLDEDAKQALLCLVPRLIDPRSGRVLIDNRDLREMTLDSVRAQVATVLQADLIFTDSVLVNIGLGDPMKTLPRVIEAAKVAHAHHFIQDLPHGYETTIGPLGHYLKPDEQFRIALARAYLHDPSILIVEEPNTPIDENTRHLIDDSLARMSIGRTLVIIPHRLSTVRSSDHVIVIHNGRAEDVGSPPQLQAESKLFRHLVYSEFNEFATGEVEAGQIGQAEVARKGG